MAGRVSRPLHIRPLPSVATAAGAHSPRLAGPRRDEGARRAVEGFSQFVTNEDAAMTDERRWIPAAFVGFAFVGLAISFCSGAEDPPSQPRQD